MLNNTILLIRSSLFFIGMILITVVHATLSLLTFCLPYKIRYYFITFWSRLITWWLCVTCGIKYRVEGLENIPKTSAVILSNHQSTWETIAFQVIFPMQSWALKKELLNIPFFGWALRLLEPIAIDRNTKNSAIEQLVKQGSKRLQQGRWVVIFPEGRRMPPNASIKFARGGAKLAVKSGFPVIPVAHNAGEFWPRKGFLKKPGVITVKIGPIIETQGLTAKAVNLQAQAWVAKALAS